MISDVFTQRGQFEWMFDTLLEVHKNHPVEDELVTQYAIPGICKAAAVLGLVSIWFGIMYATIPERLPTLRAASSTLLAVISLRDHPARTGAFKKTFSDCGIHCKCVMHPQNPETSHMGLAVVRYRLLTFHLLICDVK